MIAMDIHHTADVAMAVIREARIPDLATSGIPIRTGCNSAPVGILCGIPVAVVGMGVPRPNAAAEKVHTCAKAGATLIMARVISAAADHLAVATLRPSHLSHGSSDGSSHSHSRSRRPNHEKNRKSEETETPKIAAAAETGPAGSDLSAKADLISLQVPACIRRRAFFFRDHQKPAEYEAQKDRCEADMENLHP